MIHRILFIFALLSAITAPIFAMEINRDDELIQSLINCIDGIKITLSDPENNADDIIIFLCDFNDENADPSSVPVEPSSPSLIPMDEDDPARSERKRKKEDLFSRSMKHYKKSKKK